ncbi:helix-turn-helix transcriptional regulator [Actinomadura keratinilytica]|uniref:Helix-turn-helix transcriptional regulator n=2 Tax=Actinomadura keratinilytica TaxID=547461 RepID=A0ABP7XWF3_9ACTN
MLSNIFQRDGPMAYVPTIRGRRLARELRQAREGLGLTGELAAQRLGWNQAKISRIETAKMRATVGEVMELCEAYKIAGSRREELITLAREAKKQGWWHSYLSVLKSGFGDYLEFESEADQYRSHDVHLIPGLFQTEAYARAVFRTSTALTTPEEIDRAVEARLARQKRLTSSERPLRVSQIIEEGALRRVIGTYRTMREQLRHLIELAQLPNVEVQIASYRSTNHVAFDGPFTLLHFADYPDVLYVEHFMGCQYYEKPEETAHGSVVLERLRRSALNPSDSIALIRQVIEEMPDEPEGRPGDDGFPA